MFEFFASATQQLSPSILLLPQAGSTFDGSGRPLNSYAILREGYSILFDAPFRWCLDGIVDLTRLGQAPQAMFLSHADLVQAGDAFFEVAEAYGVEFFLHHADQPNEEQTHRDFRLNDLPSEILCRELGFEIIEIPGRTAGSIMVYLPAERVLLTGDAAIGCGPKSAPSRPILESPRVKPELQAEYLEIWEGVIANREVDMMLTLRGQGCSRNTLGSQFDHDMSGILRAPIPAPGGSHTTIEPLLRKDLK